MKRKILVLGASGMLGNAVLRYLLTEGRREVVGIVRSQRAARNLPTEVQAHVAVAGDMDNSDVLARTLLAHNPAVVINCIGLVKQLDDGNDPLAAIAINSVLPHRLARLCALTDARLIHMSTDCVFSGRIGMYTEEDVADAVDVYGRTKLLGEVVDQPHTLTLRTSIIGHELSGAHSLVCWFLSQNEQVRGFSRAVFSGLPAVDIARILDQHVLDRPDLHGLYHLSADPIDKFGLLTIIKDTYGKQINIIEDDSFVIDRSLDSSRFRNATGFQPRPWHALVQHMHDFR